MVDKGHEVIAFAPGDDKQVREKLSAIGVKLIEIPMARTGLNPIADVYTLYSLWRHFLRLKPDIVLPYTMKPIIYGCLAARLARVPHRFALFTGLGHIFSQEEYSTRTRIVRLISVWLYRVALAGVDGIFVYNEADREDVERYCLVSNETRIQSVPGSGVDLDYFPAVKPPKDAIRFLLIARLLREKGVFEYASAARLLRQKYSNVRFQLLGPYDPYSSSIKKAEIDTFVREGILEYLGETRDVRPYLAASSVFVLPTYYREGIPRSILEAMATGRAIITTDTPGCRETVVDGKNGILVPIRDHVKLAQAMEKLIINPHLLGSMGLESSKLASERFNVHVVNRLILEGMRLH